jgi:hypothetical protein
MQSCGSQLSACTNSCISGVPVRAIAPVLPPPPRPSLSQSQPLAPSLPLAGQQDELSSSQSSLSH